MILKIIKVVVLSFAIGLTLLTNVLCATIEWKVDTICTYEARSNTTPEHSNCIKLNNIVMVSSSKNFIFLSTKDPEIGTTALYIFDLRDKNMTDDKFIYANFVTPIAKYKMSFSILGTPTALCADENLFAYATPNYDFVLVNNFVKVKEENLGEKIASCDIFKGNIAMCVGNNVWFMDLQGNVKWKREAKGCKNVKILNNNVFVEAANKFFVFSKEGTNIFSKNVNIRGMAGTDKIAIITPDGIYVFDEYLNALSLLVEEPTVIGIAGLNGAIAYITPSTLRLVDYNKSVIYEETIKPGDQFVSIKGNKDYAVALTNVKDPDSIIIDVGDDEEISIKKIAIDDINNKARLYHVKDGMWISSLPDNSIVFKNLVGISANESIAKGEKTLSDFVKIGAIAEKKEIEDLLNEMKKEFNEGNYEKVFEIEKILRAKEKAIGSYYVLEEKKLTDNILEMASRKGLVLTTGIKLRYNNAIEKILAGNYKGAIDDFKAVRIETEQHIRDEALTLLSEAEKRKSALEKYAESTEEITLLYEKIISERDYVNAFVLFDDVKALENLTIKRLKKLFDDAEKEKEEAKEPWLIFEADVKEIEELLVEARIAEYKGEYEKMIEKLSKAKKKAREYDTISKAQDVCVIGIIFGVIVLIVLIIRMPKIKEKPK